MRNAFSWMGEKGGNEKLKDLLPGSEEEIREFKYLQQQFSVQFRDVFPDKMAPKTIVIVPSLTLDYDILQRIEAANHYEERLLCLLMLLRMPKTHVVYITSTSIDPVIVDYYLHLLPGITGYHARQRLTLLSCSDNTSKSLTEKILDRPLLIQRIKESIPPGHPAHIACFNVTEKERTLAVKLGLPIYGCDPDLLYLGTKSGSRMIFKWAGIDLPAGFEDIKNEEEIIEHLFLLKKQQPSLQKAVLKMNDGFSGEGNAVFSFKGAPGNSELKNWIKGHLPEMKITADNLTYRSFIEKFEKMGGIGEAFIDGEMNASPSVQCRINPLGEIDIISTHDQVLGGKSGQEFLGASFPASAEYAVEVAEISRNVAVEMKKAGVVGRFGIDFLSFKENGRWKHYAIEINLRKGGTTHPFLMLQFLTGGKYCADTGEFEMHDGKKRYYFASDNFKSDLCRGLTPDDLIDIAICNDIHYNSTKEEGVMFHLIGALSQYGKLGIVCIADSAAKAKELYNKTVDILTRNGKKTKGQEQLSTSRTHHDLPVL